jgi:ubiquinone/menaquinone biosynthesis C-methylase UbiE
MNSVAGTESILDRLYLESGMQILDVGCGPGRLTVPAAQLVGPQGHITALDIQENMLRRLQQKLVETGLSNVKPVRAGAGDGKIGHENFDRALLVTVLGEIPDRKAALAEIFNALKPGGILSITEVLPDPHFQLPRTVRRLASQVGFQEQAYFGGFPAFTIHLCKPVAEHKPAS